MRYPCDKCGSNFGRPRDLESHLAVSNGPCKLDRHAPYAPATAPTDSSAPPAAATISTSTIASASTAPSIPTSADHTHPFRALLASVDSSDNTSPASFVLTGENEYQTQKKGKF